MGVLSDSAWQTMQDALAARFEPEEIGWRVQGKAGPNQRAQVLAYQDARNVQDRLDAVVGMGNWSFEWTPIVTDAKSLQVVKGTLTIHGVSKSDVGDASNFEGNKGAVSDAFKRAAVMWGIGRYLYDLPATWVMLDDHGNIGARQRQQLQAVLEGKPMPAEQPREAQRPSPAPARQPEQPAQEGEQPANEGQKQSLQKLYIALGEVAPPMESFTFASAGAKIRELSRRYNNKRRAS